MLIIVINNLINNFGNKNLFKLIINLYYFKNIYKYIIYNI